MRHRSDEEGPPPDRDVTGELVTRLSRPHPSGGVVIERAAILASGANAMSVLRWIEDRGGVPEAAAGKTSSGGLHGDRMQSGAKPPQPLRYVLPPGALATDRPDGA
jgi:hypothetical protein